VEIMAERAFPSGETPSMSIWDTFRSLPRRVRAPRKGEEALESR
jgi:hypothetical protein